MREECNSMSKFMVSYSQVPKDVSVSLFLIIFSKEIDVKMSQIGVKTGPNKRISLKKINTSIYLLGS